jgi:hypothetical protein
MHLYVDPDVKYSSIAHTVSIGCIRDALTLPDVTKSDIKEMFVRLGLHTGRKDIAHYLLDVMKSRGDTK